MASCSVQPPGTKSPLKGALWELRPAERGRPGVDKQQPGIDEQVEFLDERHSLACLFLTAFYMHPDEASHGRITGFEHLTPVFAYLQRLDGRQSISMRKIPAWRIVQISCGKECRARLGQVGTAAGVIAHSFFGQSLSDSQLSRATIIHAKQSEMPIRTFFSEVHAARAPTFEDSAETERSN